MTRLLLYGTGAFIGFLCVSVLMNRQGDMSDILLAVFLLIACIVFGGDDLLRIWRRRIKDGD